MRHYSDFFTISEDYSPVMTREEINKTPDRWLDFYPHTEFETICNTLLTVLKTGEKSVWITGNLGTGKSNASLVIQKLFMDSEARVHKWFDEYASNGLSDRDSFEKKLFERRKEGTLVVYDYKASSVGADSGLLVRLEKGIIAALNERGLSVPAMSNLDTLIERIKREGKNFFKTRDSIQSHLAYLHHNIKTVDQLVNELNNPTVSSNLLNDVETVLHKDSIYLDFDVPMFRKWIKTVLSDNKLQRIVYLFDEFHPFIEANKAQLKTFEDVTESPGVNRFFLVPVTHMEINAYLAEGSESAKKANDRFYFRRLQMPNDTAFRLAKHAMVDSKDKKIADEWKKSKDELWDSVSTIVNKFNNPDDPTRDRFYDILPIHPMAAFLLKHLSEQARSNQRSFFEYLKGGADSTEFQEFIRTGGPEVANKQFLTVDYLWHYFIDRDDLGLDSEIANIGAFYKQTYNRTFQNQVEDDPKLRVLKAVLLFCLLDKLAPGGHDRLKPTVENIELSFKGDGTIADPRGIVEELEKNHCFSVTNENISLFTASNVKPEEIKKYYDKFHELLHQKVEDELVKHTQSYRKYCSGRFDIRVSDSSHATLTNITSDNRDKYSSNIGKDDGSICLWFVVAKDHDEQLQISKRIKSILQQLNDHRILMFTFPELSFCHNNKSLWNEYIRQYAQFMTENDGSAKNQIRKSLDMIENEWINELKKNDTLIQVHCFQNNEIKTSDTSWSQFRELLNSYMRKKLEFCVDQLGFQDPHFANTSLKAYAKAGITFTAASGPIASLVNTLKKNGVTDNKDWFAKNPDHSLSVIHTLFKKKFSNSVEKGGQQSICEIYRELKRAPYGLRYTALSAFVLGYCLRDILQKNYRWTNGQMSVDLDSDTLAEIIESVVRDDGGNKLGSKEKLICMLSADEKSFIENAPIIFGISASQDATIESILKQIQGYVEKISAKVPFWMLTEFIRNKKDSDADLVETILNNICTAFSTSSKGNIEERTSAVKETGKIFHNNSAIVKKLASYIKTENFIKAFEIYVDKENTSLSKLAESIGDVSHEYCRVILNHCQEAAGWLWNKADITREIDDVICEYEIIKLAKPLCGFVNYVHYENVYSAIKSAVTVNNHLPKELIETTYPPLSEFLAAMQSVGSPQNIKIALEQYSDSIQKLFFDHTKSESLLILKTELNGIFIEDVDLLSILNSIQNGFEMDVSSFINTIQDKIEESAKHSVVKKIKVEWKRISSTDTPNEWAINNRIPARYVFGLYPDSVDLLRAVEQPEVLSASKLEEMLEVLKEVKPANIIDCQKALMAEIIPLQFRNFEISLAALLVFLQEKFGNQPNGWPIHPDITEFIKSQYKLTIAPQIKEKLRSKTPEELKQKLLQLADENPELGLLFWEDL